MAKNKHIVILTPGFPENEADTTCIPALQIYVKALQDSSGYDISIISFHYPKKSGLYLWNDIPVYTLAGSSVFTKILLWQKAYKTLKQIHLKKPITTLHSFWLGECAFVGHRFSKKNHIKHIVTLMGQDALKGNRYAKILPLKKLQLVTLSDFHRKTLEENYNAKSEVIPWGINPEDFHYPTEKTIDIIGVGSLITLKNYELFIDVIYQINREKPIKAVLIGDGILREKLQKKIRLLHLENTIELKGALHYNDTLKYMSQSRILLHTSHYESFGLVFPEALQSRTMIVSRNIGCAFLSKNWAFANTANEMTVACNGFLSRSFLEEENPFIINKTVQHYSAIYELQKHSI